MTQKSELAATNIRVTFDNGESINLQPPIVSDFRNYVDAAITVIQVEAEKIGNNPTNALSNRIAFLYGEKVISTFTRADKNQNWMPARNSH